MPSWRVVVVRVRACPHNQRVDIPGVSRVAVRCRLCRRLLAPVDVARDEGWCDVYRDVAPDGQPFRTPSTTYSRHRLAGHVFHADEHQVGGRYRFVCDSRRHRNGAKLDRVLLEETLLELCITALAGNGKAELLL